jgi:hypothetical protein
MAWHGYCPRNCLEGTAENYEKIQIILFLIQDSEWVPRTPETQSVTLACLNRMLWVEMVYAKATERSLSLWYTCAALSTLLSHVLLQSISHEENFSNNDAILSASDEFFGRVAMRQRKPDGNATVGREWETWRVIPTILGISLRRFATVAKRRDYSAWLDIINVWIILQQCVIPGTLVLLRLLTWTLDYQEWVEREYQ